MHTRCKMKVKLTRSLMYTDLSQIRNVEIDDIDALSTLFYEGFKHSIDYRGESKDSYKLELKTLFHGLYGQFLFSSSYTYFVDNQLVSASLITKFKNVPLLIYAVTLPSYENKGIFSKLLQKSMNQLLAEGYKEMYLVVTEKNVKALELYKKHGFYKVKLTWDEILNNTNRTSISNQ